MRRTWRWVLGVLIALVLVTVLVLWLLLRGSLADLDCEHALPGLAKPVTLERDGVRLDSDIHEQGTTLRSADVDSDRAHDGVRLRRGSSVPSAN